MFKKNFNKKKKKRFISNDFRKHFRKENSRNSFFNKLDYNSTNTIKNIFN